MSVNEELIINLKKTHFNNAKDAINKLLEKNIKFDGIFAVNDWLALGALYSLKDNNFKIPEDVKIVGFDNVSISDRKSTRLNSSHVSISYAVFCLKKKKKHRLNLNL